MPNVRHQRFCASAIAPCGERVRVPASRRSRHGRIVVAGIAPSSAPLRRLSCLVRGVGTPAHRRRLESSRSRLGRGFQVRGLGFGCSHFERVSYMCFWLFVMSNKSSRLDVIWSRVAQLFSLGIAAARVFQIWNTASFVSGSPTVCARTHICWPMTLQLWTT